MYNHLVLSGGLIYGCAFYGTLKEMHRCGRWSNESLKSVHATSVGCVVAIFVAMMAHVDTGSDTNSDSNPWFRSADTGEKLDIWDIIDRYLIDRPWQDVFHVSVSTFVHGYDRCGIMDSSCFRDIFAPLFAAFDVSIDVTLQEFYERFPVELYFMTVCLGNDNDGKGNDGGRLVELSHTTHPHWTVLDACYASCCAPVAFRPLVKEGRLYTDGCLLANYPMAQCRARYGHEPEFAQRTLGIYIHPPGPISSDTVFVTPPDLMTYLSQIMQFVVHTSNQVHSSAYAHADSQDPCDEINIDTSWYPYTALYTFIHSREDRIKMIECGIDAARRLCALDVSNQEVAQKNPI